MKTVTARQAHAHLGEVMEDSQHEPVIIQKNGRSYSVVISVREFEKIHGKSAREEKAKIPNAETLEAFKEAKETPEKLLRYPNAKAAMDDMLGE